MRKRRDILKADILIKNGLLIDPTRNTSVYGNLAVAGRSVRVVSDETPVDADVIVDAEGCLVTPGLVDFHVHVFTGGTDIGINPDIYFLPNGITTVVDGGSAVISNYRSFSLCDIAPATVTVKSFLTPSPAGFAMIKYYREDVNPAHWDEARILACIEQHRGEIVGLKARISRDIVKELGLYPLKETVRIAEKAGLPVSVHMTNPPQEVDAVLDVLRTGDTLCHAFNGQGHTILDDTFHVKKSVWDAKKRGVLFDVANGRAHFSFRTAENAMREGFFPDIISSDETAYIAYRSPGYSLPFILSKYLNMGMSLLDVIKACTITPIRAMASEAGCAALGDGNHADIAVFKLKENRTIPFYDAEGNFREGNKLLVPQMAIKDGRIVYRQVDFI